jgi:hypothetical protein
MSFLVYLLSFAMQKRTTYRPMTSPSSEHSTPNQEQGLKLSSFQSNKAPYGSASIAALNLSRAAPAVQQRNSPKQSQKQKSGNNHPRKRFKAQHDTFMIQGCALLKCQQEPEEKPHPQNSPPTGPHASEQLLQEHNPRETKHQKPAALALSLQESAPKILSFLRP